MTWQEILEGWRISGKVTGQEKADMSKAVDAAINRAVSEQIIADMDASS